MDNKNHTDIPRRSGKYPWSIVETEEGLAVKMSGICGCEKAKNWTDRDCEKYCDRYSSCYNIAIANGILAAHENGESYTGNF